MSFIVKSLRKKRGIRRYIGPKRIILLVGFILFVSLTWDYYRAGNITPAIIEQYRTKHPIGAVLLFVLIYAISVVTALPSLPFNLAGGFFWGGVIGGVYSTIGVTLGGWISFALSRWLIGQPLTERFNSALVTKVQHAFDRGGWKFVAIARINPIIPTGPFNYLLGLTSLSHKSFLWSTFVFLLPPSVAVAFIGDTLQTFSAQTSGVEDIVRSILVVSAAVVFLIVVKYISKIYKNRTEKL